MLADVYWRIEHDEGRIDHLVFDTPGASVNVLSRPAIAELGARLDELMANRPVGLIVRSAKKSGFIAGADIKEFTAIRDPAEGIELVRAGQIALQRLEDLPFPTVAAIHGFALGGGLELALACTYRIGTPDGRLALGLPEVRLGIHPGFGGTVRSVRLIGVRAAMQLMLQGKPFGAERALSAGLIDRTAGAEQLLAGAKELLMGRPPRRSSPVLDKLLGRRPMRSLLASRLRSSLVAKIDPSHYPAPFAIVELWRRHGAAVPGAYLAEAHSLGELMCSTSSRNLVRMFLLQDRLKGLGGKPKVDFKHLHVIGAGLMGADIAALAASRGLKVTLQEHKAASLDAALARARAFLDKRSATAEAAAEAMTRLRADVGGAGAADADVVIEAIPEDLDAKRALYADIETRLKPGALLASNTSSLTIETLAAKLADPTRLVGMHFFNPATQMQLVEIVQGERTQPQIALNAMAFARKLDKLPLPCRSAPGFVVNRVLLPYINEALFACEEGIPPDTIDAVGTAFGMPVGPIELADRIGLDVALQVGGVIARAFGRRVPANLARLVDQGKFGRKSGQGFYSWRNDKPLRLANAMPGSPPDLEDRLILPMLNAAAAVLREGIVADAELLDAGVVFATGFAPFRGGPLRYAADRGIDGVRRRLAQLAEIYGARFAPDPYWHTLAM